MHGVSETAYYARHFRLPGFTEQTQARLRNARVLIVGVGGLGCPIALYLAGAGVGHLTLCDADDVSLTNLHRQVLFDMNSLHRKKVDAAAERLRATNPFIQVSTVAEFADESVLAALVPAHDLVVDGTDNFDAKYAINAACERAGVPLVYGSIFQFEGQVSVFHHRCPDGSPGLSYRDLHPSAPPAALRQNCGEAGVIGVLPGVVGTLQANEAIKVLTGLGTTLSGKLMVFDALQGSSRVLSIARRRSRAASPPADAGQLEHADLLAMQRRGEALTLLDVREDAERAQASMGGIHIPLASLPKSLSSLPRAGTLIVYCQSGARSERAALYLRSVLPDLRILNLRGGMNAVAAGAAASACGSAIADAAQ